MGGKKYPKKDKNKGEKSESDGSFASQSSGSAPPNPQVGATQPRNVQPRRESVASSASQSSEATVRSQQSKPKPKNVQQEQQKKQFDAPPNQQKDNNQGKSKNVQQKKQQQQQQQPSASGVRDDFDKMSISSEKSHATQQPKGPWSNLAGKGSVPQKKQTPSAPQSQTGAIPKTQQQQRPAGKPPQQKAQEIKQVKSSAPHLLCEYKGKGSKGIKLGDIETNYLKLIIDRLNKVAYHYDVQIEPEAPKKYLPGVFQQFVRDNFPRESIAYDGSKNAYAPLVLNLSRYNPDVEFIHPETGNKRPYKVKIKATDHPEIDLSSLRTYNQTRSYDAPKRALQSLEVILKSAFQQPHLRNGVQVGRSFFIPDPPGRRVYLGQYFELWKGLFQATVLGDVPFLNVDVAHKAFPKRYQNLLDLIEDIDRDMRNTTNFNRSLDPRVTSELRRHLSGMDICYRGPGVADGGKIYKFNSVDGKPANVRFNQDGKETNVLQYFRDRQPNSIRFPEMPCLKLGNNVRNISVPIEFCSLSDAQAVNRKCTENQTRNLIREAATNTEVRKNKIMDLLRTISHNNAPIIQGFGLQIATDFAKVPARKLDAPEIQYQNSCARVNKGVWKIENQQFLIPEKASNWAIINFSNRTRRNHLDELAKQLVNYSKPLQLHLYDKPAIIDSVRYDDRNPRNPEFEKVMDQMAKSKDIRIVFCIIPGFGNIYAKVKQEAEIKCGVLTQCIKDNTVDKKRFDGSTITNILLKVNAKLNGTNHKLKREPMLNGKCMVIGADVTHPSPDQRNIPSVVGVAASHDQHAFTYNICWRLQGQRKEIIQDFRNIITEQLRFYQKKNNNTLPDKIFYYRDGVSEGQFQEVMAEEKADIVRACNAISPSYNPKLTIVIVQKRHHTRFFPGRSRMSEDRNNNVPAGTIVDAVITHPNENHFYLVSHASIQGVAKPTKYCVLLDEANHTIDELQTFTYNLCHLFTRCTRSVSYPAPTYYAHLSAYRGRVYIENNYIDMGNLDREYRTRIIKDNIIKDHPMYFV